MLDIGVQREHRHSFSPENACPGADAVLIHEQDCGSCSRARSTSPRTMSATGPMLESA
jgi:hypothetical protein